MRRPPSRRLLKQVHDAIARYHAFVYRFAYRVVRNQADAEDVAQTVFLKLLHSPDVLAEVSTLRAWLAQVTWNAAVSFLRSEERRKRRERAWVSRHRRTEADRTEGGDGMLENDAIQEAISQLPEDLRVPVILYYQEGLKYREIARVCGCPEGTVAQRLSRAKRRLKQKLGASGALSAFPGVEAALRSEAPIPCSAGLEQTLVRGVNAEFAQLAGTTTATLSAASGGVATSAIAFKLGTALLLSTALVTSAWVVASRVTTRDAVSSAAAKRVLSTSSAGERARRAPVVLAPDAEEPGRIASHDPIASEPEETTPDDAVVVAEHAGSTLFGWVRDADGRPVEGARVSITDDNPNTVLKTTTTDAEGYYELQNIADALGADLRWIYSNTAVNSEWMRSYGNFVDFAEGSVQSVSFSPDGGMLTASGIVLTDFSKSGESLQVRLHETADAQRARAKREQERAAQKAAELEVERLRAEELRARELAEAQKQLARYELDTLGYRQAVLDAEQAAVKAEQAAVSVTEAAVRALRVSDGERLWVAGDSYETMAELDLANGAHVGSHRLLVVELEGYETAVSERFELEEGETRHMDVELEEAKLLSGTVLSETGEPITGAEVRVVAHTAPQLFPDSVCRVETDEDGRFEFTSLFQGTFVLRAHAPGFRSTEVVTPSGRATEIRLTPAASLTARVVRGGTGDALDGIRVEVRDGEHGEHVVSHAVTGEDGVASLTDLPAGDYLVNAYREGSKSTYSRARRDVRLQAGSESEVELVIEYKVDVRGVVFPVTGEKVAADLRVVAVPLDGFEYPAGRLKSGSVDEDGSFRVKSLAPGGYLLGVVDSRFENGRDLLTSIEVELAPGSDDEYEIRLLPPEPAGLDVVVYGPQGAPLPEARVELTRVDFGTDLGTQVTGEDGQVSFETLPGLFDLRVRAGKEHDGQLGTAIVRDVVLGPFERRPIEVRLEPRELLGSLEAYAEHFPFDSQVAIQNGVRLDSLLDLLERSGHRRFAVAPEAAPILARSQREGTAVRSAAQTLRASLADAGLGLEAVGGRLWVVVK